MEPTRPIRHIGHIPGLDGLRGLTLPLVLAAHLVVFVPFERLRWIQGDFIALDCFFVLSGFLITALLLKEDSRFGRIDWRNFYTRRALRLFPALAVLLIGYVTYTVLANFPGEGTPAFTRANVFSIAFYYWNWRIALNAPGSFFWPGDLKHLWSLSVEEQFYLVWPIVIALVLTVRRSVTFIVVIMGGAIIGIGLYRALLFRHDISTYALYVRTDTRADALIMGALVAHLWVRGYTPRKYLAAAAWISLAFLAWCLSNLRTASPALYEWSVFTLIEIAWGLVVLAVAENAWSANRFWELRPLRAMGRVSYGAYLWHLPIYFAVLRWTRGSSALLQVPLALGLTAAATVASWHLVEKPFLKRKPKVTTPPADAPAASPS